MKYNTSGEFFCFFVSLKFALSRYRSDLIGLKSCISRYFTLMEQL